jgi:hypothetical protein
MKKLVCILFLSVSFLSPHLVHAQFISQAALRFESSVESPKPGESITLTLTSPSIELGEATIAWQLNGTIMRAGVGESSVDIVAPAAGTTVQIVAAVVAKDGTTARSTYTVSPASVDILYSAQSYIPTQYKGRALASTGSMVLVEAMPFVVEGGARVARASLNYEWTKDGARIQSGVGKYSITVPAALSGETVVRVRVTTRTGSARAEDVVTIPTQEPQILMYEYSPALGLNIHQASIQALSPSLAEVIISAQPYYIPFSNIKSTVQTFDWSVNGTRVITDPTHPNSIALGATTTEAQANVTLDISYTATFVRSLSKTVLVSMQAARDAVRTSRSDPFK